MKINYLLSLIIILSCSLSSCNKKYDKPAFVDKYFQVEQFLVDGEDSTLAIKNKPHYSYIYFVDDQRKSIIANPLSYNNHSGFSGGIGQWSLRNSTSLLIYISSLPGGEENVCGPYWKSEQINWTIIDADGLHLHLETDYEGKHYVYKLAIF